MNRSFFTIILMASCLQLSAQLTIEECHERAEANYPLIKQYDLIKQSEEYSLNNVSKGWMPQVSLSGQATYQSEVVELPFSLPGVDIPQISKFQYKAVAQVEQTIWDGGATKAARQTTENRSMAETAQVEVEMYDLKRRVNDLFFGILLLDEQIKISELFRADLASASEKMKSYMENGVAHQSDLDLIKVEMIEVKRNIMELETNREAYRQMLFVMIGEEADSNITLVKPSEVFDQSAPNNRPELKMFEAQTLLLQAQTKSITAKNLPYLGLFVQGGISNPGLNILKEGTRPFAIGGVRFSWNFGNLYTSKNNLESIDNQIRSIDVQKEAFLFNSDLQSRQLSLTLEKYNSMLTDDDEIIKLRSSIKNGVEVNVENGTMNANDLLKEMNAEQNAVFNKALHEIEMLKTIHELKILSNN